MSTRYVDAGRVDPAFGQQDAQILFDPRRRRSVKVHLELNAAAVLKFARLARIHGQHPLRDAQHTPYIFNELRSAEYANFDVKIPEIFSKKNSFYATNRGGLRTTINLKMSLSGWMLAQANRSLPPSGDRMTMDRPITENFPSVSKKISKLNQSNERRFD